MESRSDPPEHAAIRAESAADATNLGRAADRSPRVVAEFSAFYREFTPTLVAFLVWQGARVSDATEIAQDTMTLVFQSWESIRQPKAWARTVASRGYARRIGSLQEDPTDPLPTVHTPLLPIDTDLDALTGRHEVLRLLALLPPRQRQVMAWTYDGYHPTEIAQELALTPEAVRASLLKARRTLAEYLAGGKEADR
jgi:RNA polymerase sigma-70 factor (ECF subfamily)